MKKSERDNLRALIAVDCKDPLLLSDGTVFYGYAFEICPLKLKLLLDSYEQLVEALKAINCADDESEMCHKNWRIAQKALAEVEK